MSHKLRIVSQGSGDVLVTIECNEPDGAICRVQCPKGCETYTYPEHEHGLENRDVCNADEWMSAWDDIFDSYNGPEGVRFSDGMEILVEWTGDGYLWKPIDSSQNPSEVSSDEQSVEPYKPSRRDGLAIFIANLVLRTLATKRCNELIKEIFTVGLNSQEKGK